MWVLDVIRQRKLHAREHPARRALYIVGPYRTHRAVVWHALVVEHQVLDIAVMLSFLSHLLVPSFVEASPKKIKLVSRAF